MGVRPTTLTIGRRRRFRLMFPVRSRTANTPIPSLPPRGGRGPKAAARMLPRLSERGGPIASAHFQRPPPRSGGGGPPPGSARGRPEDRLRGGGGAPQARRLAYAPLFVEAVVGLEPSPSASLTTPPAWGGGGELAGLVPGPCQKDARTDREVDAGALGRRSGWISRCS